MTTNFSEFMKTLQRPLVGVTWDPDFQKICGDDERTRHLVRLCGKSFGRGLDLDTVTQACLDWNSRNTPPLDETKVRDTCQSMQRTHRRKHPAPVKGTGRDQPLFDIAQCRADRYISNPPPDRKWLFKDVLPLKTAGIIVSPGGMGKTYFVMQLAASVASGLPFAGAWEVGEKGSALLLLAEDDDEELHRRTEVIFTNLAMKQDFPALTGFRNALYVRSMVGENCLMTVRMNTGEVEQTDFADRLIATVKGLPDLRLIVIDPASRFRGGDENKAEDTTRFVQALEKIVQATGANVLVVHHTHKLGDSTQTAARGSSALTDGVRWQANLSKLTSQDRKDRKIPVEADQYYLKVTISKSNYAAPRLPLILKRGDDGYLAATGTPVKAPALAQIETEVIDLIRIQTAAGKTFSLTRFVRDFGGSSRTLKTGENKLREILKGLIEAGHLSNTNGKISLPNSTSTTKPAEP